MKRQIRNLSIFILFSLCLSLAWTDHSPAADPLDNWHLRMENTYAYGLGYGNGVFVAVGDGEIMTSPDGAAWVSRTSGTEWNLSAVAYGKGKFVAVGEKYGGDTGSASGVIVTSADNGVTWEEKYSAVDVPLLGIAYGNGKFVAVGEKYNSTNGYGSGAVVTSADGELWSPRYLGPYVTFWAITTNGSGTFVAVGENWYTGAGTIATSSDNGLTWLTKSSGPDEYLLGVAYGNGSFIAAGWTYGGGGKILTSRDNGATWLMQASGLSGNVYLNDIAYGSGMFVAVGEDYQNWSTRTALALTSPDGATWTSRTSVAPHLALTAVAFGRVTFVALTDAGGIIQSDPLPSLNSVTINGGAAYTAQRSVNLTLTTGDPGSATEMQFSNDQVIWSVPEPFSTAMAWTLSAGDGPKNVYVRFKDPEGNWSEAFSATIILDTAPPAASAQPPGGAYPEAQLVTLNANEPSSTIFYTLDGSPPTADSPVYQEPIALRGNRILRYFARDQAGNSGEIKTESYQISLHPLDNWHLRAENTPAYGLGFGNGAFVAVGYAGSVMTSPDGAAWTVRDPGASAFLSGVAYGNGTFAAVGEDGTILTSADSGTTWLPGNSGVIASLWAIAYGNGVFAAVGNNGTIVTSVDNGATWVLGNSGVIASLWTIAYGNGVFAAVGDNGTIVTSVDGGATWVSHNSGTNEYIWGISYGKGLFTAVGTAGTILTSADNGVTWTPQTSGVNADLDFYGIAYGNGLFTAVGENYASATSQIMTSADGTTWMARTSPVPEDQLLAVAFGKGTFVAVSAAGNVIQSDLLKGDVNNDWRVDVADVILGLKVMDGGRPPEVRSDYPFSETDPDGNGRIGLPDVIYILQKISGRR